MKNLLLGTAAIAGLVLASAPAAAQMELTIGGHSKNYVGWLDQDEATSGSTNEFDILRETELHFNGESTLDSGLTFGFQVEAEVDGGDSSTVEESYIYLSGGFGRINLGSEDGAGYLLQVSAPSADSNIDGIRQYINPINFGAAPAGSAAATTAGGNWDYAMDQTGTAEKITYLSSNYAGLQIGASFTPQVSGDNGSSTGLAGFNTDVNGAMDDVYEAAVRYEGAMSNFGYALGAGYLTSDDSDAWNAGLDVDAGPFGIGVVYTDAEDITAPGGALDTDQLVVGIDYTTGPIKLGASYFDEDADGAGAVDTTRYTGGVVYTAGPGLSFRGSVSQFDQESTGATDFEATSVMGGIQINF